MTTLSVFGLIIGIITLITLSYRGVHTVMSALAASIIIMLTNGMDLWTAINKNFMTSAGGFVTTYFLLFALGAVFGEVMSQSGCASTIAKNIVDTLGKKYVLMGLVIITAILSYAGISIFVIVFVIYPLAVPLFKEANISMNILPGLILLAGVTLMLAAPGSPTATNATPTSVLGTTIYAAPIMGVICLVFAFILGYFYLTWTSKKLTNLGVGFMDDRGEFRAYANDTDTDMPSFGVAIIPVICVIAVVFATKGILGSFDSINTGLFCGIVLTVLMNMKRFKGGAMSSIYRGVNSSMSPAITTAAIIGFGGVVQAAPAFQVFVAFSEYLSLVFNPYISGFISINIMSGITGAALSGMKIFTNSMLPTYLNLGINREAMHRILVISSGGLDTLPHCSTLAILFGVMKLTHKQAYKHVFVLSVLLPLLTALLAIALAFIGIV